MKRREIRSKRKEKKTVETRKLSGIWKRKELEENTEKIKKSMKNEK